MYLWGVAIPSITGLHSYRKRDCEDESDGSVAIPSITGLHSYIESVKIKPPFGSRNPFYYRSSFIPQHWRRWGKQGRNPFYYRSSFIPSKESHVLYEIEKSQSLLLQVFIHTRFIKYIAAKMRSQSLLLQVFIHTS